ncbi:unnamed protein product [Clonostachys byssicola]|uniref:PXMP2/4 family protein 3 n=1 Tax=Clonostachys byssicola TaxID=160290 RepID=A0A9N9XZM2_9HYPO|nr:unnamed protein product [Clonostachys byssicola]
MEVNCWVSKDDTTSDQTLTHMGGYFAVNNALWHFKQEFIEREFPAYQSVTLIANAEPIDSTNSKSHNQREQGSDAKIHLNLRNTAIKVFLDNTIVSIVNTFLFVIFMNFMKSSMGSSQIEPTQITISDGVAHYGISTDIYQQFVSLLIAGWRFWPIVSLINFALLKSAQGRNLMSGLAGLVWGVYVSIHIA